MSEFLASKKNCLVYQRPKEPAERFEELKETLYLWMEIFCLKYFISQNHNKVIVLYIWSLSTVRYNSLTLVKNRLPYIVFYWDQLLRAMKSTTQQSQFLRRYEFQFKNKH